MLQSKTLSSEQVSLESIEWLGNGHLRLLDQRRLPDRIAYRDCNNVAEVAESIASLVVRGGPAMGIAAAYGIAMAAGGGFRHARRRTVNRDQSVLGAGYHA